MFGACESTKYNGLFENVNNLVIRFTEKYKHSIDND